MKQKILTIIFLLFCISGTAQNSRVDYIIKYQPLAIKEMSRSGIPASIKIAQACLESADGNSRLSKESNNHFGIKCKLSWTGEKVYFDDDSKNECFRKYKTVEDSYIDHTNFLMQNPRYSDLFRLETTDYIGWARGLKKAGYATARHYDKRLIDIIEEHQLFQLDHKIALDELTVFEQKRIGNKGISNTLTIDPFHSHEVIKMNRLNSVVARKGDTFEMIAQEFNLEHWEIYKFNDRPPGYVPQSNEVIYIQRKKRRTTNAILSHSVKEGDTMHFISQLYGIRLKPLYFRNNMKLGEEPVPGQIINLRKKRKKTG